ncbi:MAG: hypothetical protein WA190_11840 [Usitatibacter sp.]
MGPAARLVRAFLLAVALFAGQQAVVMHGLEHAIDQLTQKDAKPGPGTCDQCFTCAELSGAVGSAPLQLPVDCATPVQAGVPLARDAEPAPRLAFRSRAPPIVL